ncbi:hypothetical protein [Chryseobacterium luteum]|uniref:Uncharacterized protein n=1 Tax=Chryseobacterium luteum TaxID=421531 RepID=A0A085Z3K1_9FLAO|nr:hypothetical protein [Chryseobacterium luteum]KFE99014.1 hypothetical protein IX38_18420 [Chryseobacterium luteum]
MKFSRILWIIGSLISLIAIVMPVIFYVINFHENDRSTDPADWGVFGDYLGGILNPIISFLTLIITVIIAVNISGLEKRNHDESVHNPIKPFFIINNLDFFSADVSRFSFKIGQNFYSYSPPIHHATPYEYINKVFFLQVENKGLGLATELQVTFKVDLTQLKQLLEFNNPELKITVSDILIRPDGREFINVNLRHATLKSSFLIFESETIGMGVVDKGEKTELRVPSLLMKAFEIHNYLQEFSLRADFPLLSLIFQYKNINGKLLNSHFEVALLHLQDQTNYSVYRVVNRQLQNNNEV